MMMMMTIWGLAMVMGLGVVEGQQMNLGVELETPAFFLNDEIINSVVRQVREMLRQERQYLNTRLTKFETTMEDARLGVEAELGRVEAEVGTVEAEVATVKVKVDEIMVKVEGMAQKLTTLATRGELVEVEANVSTLVNSSAGKIEEALADVATQTGVAVKLEEIMEIQLQGLKQEVRQEVGQVRQKCDSCAQANTVAQVLTGATVTQNAITLLSRQLNTTTTACNQSCGSVKEEVRRVASDGCAASTVLAQRVTNLGMALEDIQLSVGNILNFTRPPPPPPTTTLAPQPDDVSDSGEENQPGTRGRELRGQTACEDSTFLDRSQGLDVCLAAIRFHKCWVTLIAYHCCHTCTSQGHLPEDGPWRYLVLTRQIRTLKALQLMRRL